MEMVRADSSFNIAAADPEVWHGVRMRCISGEAWQGDTIKMAYFKLETSQEIGSEESSQTSTQMQGITDTVYRL